MHVTQTHLVSQGAELLLTDEGLDSSVSGGSRDIPLLLIET